jgi:hypothetical protein
MVDVRRAGNRQGEAVNFYLLGILRTIRDHGSYSLPPGVESIVISHDHRACFDGMTLTCYSKLLGAGIPIGFEQKRKSPR